MSNIASPLALAPVSTLNPSLNACFGLARIGIHTVGQLCDYSELDLFAEGIAPSEVWELRDRLGLRRLALRGETVQ